MVTTCIRAAERSIINFDMVSYWMFGFRIRFKFRSWGASSDLERVESGVEDELKRLI